MNHNYQLKTILLPFITLAMAILFPVIALTQDASTKPSQDGYEFKVITYNICGLPDLITYDRNLAPTKKRFSYIGDKLNEYDIIGLQEAFVGEKEIIEKKLATYHVARGTDVGMSKNMGSGVELFSKWSMKRIFYERWRKTTGPDAMSHKGFIMVTIKVSEDLWIDVYNLHAQAGGSKEKIDIDNMYQLAEAMDLITFGSGRPMLLIGDFNCRFGDDQCNTLLEETGVVNFFPEQEGVDHMFYHENDSGWKIEVVDYRAVFTEEPGGARISDHHGMETVFRFTKK